MKRLNSILFISLYIISLTPTLSAEENLNDVLDQVKKYAKSLPNKTHPALPTQGDIIFLEQSLELQLPECLKQFHLKCGNLCFKVIFPTIHNNSQGEEYQSELSDFIYEGHRIGVPETLIPFCHYGDYVCINPQTNAVQYFSRSKIFEKSKPQPFADWLKETLLPK
jgi:hypothetical protein